MSWMFLITATLLDVFATIYMKQSNGFSRLLPTFMAVTLFGLSIFSLALALKEIDIVPVYVVWMGLGTALITVIGVMFFSEVMNPLKFISVAMVVLGVIGITIASRSAAY